MMNDRKMPKGYIILWSIMTAAYAIWMFFMKNTVLVTFETLEARTVNLFKGQPPVVFDDITGMTGRHWLYPIWVLVSITSLAFFMVYLKTILYSEKQPGKFIKYFCMVSLVFNFVFVTWYALMGGRYTLVQKIQNVTSSMNGLDFPWHFRMWGVFTSAAVFTNTIYAYRKHNFNSKAGIILGSIGSAAIFMTVNLPSIGEEADFFDPRCLFHWLGALLFAFFSAAPLGIFLFVKMKEGKKYYKGTFILFVSMIVVMTALLVIVGKSAFIENLPIWIAYIDLFLLNFTDIYRDDKLVEKKKK